MFDYSKYSEDELYEKLASLNKKLRIAYNMSDPSVATMIEKTIDTINEEMTIRHHQSINVTSNTIIDTDSEKTVTQPLERTSRDKTTKTNRPVIIKSQPKA